MNQHIKWLADREDEIGALYRTAAEQFTVHPKFSRFLLTLAEQEGDHGHLLRQLQRRDPAEQAEIALLCDPIAKEKTERLLSKNRQRLMTGKLTEEEVLEVVVSLEFSEWNSIFLLAMNWRSQSDREFRQTLEEIELHRKTVENYLLQLPGADALYQIIQRLAPLWKKRILIVDDDPMIARLLSIVMTPYGDLEVTTRATEALTHLRQNHFDMIVSDVCMPEMDGIEFYRQAIALSPELREHFLFFTATNHAEHLRFIAEHHIPTLKKPAPIKVLRTTMSSLLN